MMTDLRFIIARADRVLVRADFFSGKCLKEAEPPVSRSQVEPGNEAIGYDFYSIPLIGGGFFLAVH